MQLADFDEFVTQAHQLLDTARMLNEEPLTDALRKALNPVVAVRARTFAGQVRWDGATVAACQLEVEYGAAGNWIIGA